MLGNVKRPYRQRLIPLDLGYYIFVDQEGMSEYAGQVVTVLAHYGPFRRIRTEDGREFSGVGKGMLEPITKGRN